MRKKKNFSLLLTIFYFFFMDFLSRPLTPITIFGGTLMYTVHFPLYTPLSRQKNGVYRRETVLRGGGDRKRIGDKMWVKRFQWENKFNRWFLHVDFHFLQILE